VLSNIALTTGRKVAGGTELYITNEELANSAALTVFETSRLISEWQRTGVLVKQRGRVILRSLRFS